MISIGQIPLREECYVETRVSAGGERRGVGPDHLSVDAVGRRRLSVGVGWLNSADDVNAGAFIQIPMPARVGSEYCEVRKDRRWD